MKRVERSRNREKHSTTSRASPNTSLYSYLLPKRALQQNSAKTRFLFLLTIKQPGKICERSKKRVFIIGLASIRCQDTRDA